MRFPKLSSRSVQSDDPEKRLVEVGWLLQASQATFIWDTPRPFKRGDTQPASVKSVTFCPAVLDLREKSYGDIVSI